MTSHAQQPRQDATNDLKADLRAKFLTKRATLSQNEPTACADIANHIGLLLDDRPDAVVAGYMSMRGELDLLTALTVLQGKGHTLCLPVTDATPSPLAFRRWATGTPLVSGAFGTLCPENTAEALLPDVVLVPLLAFDRMGNRLGYGKGYYDRTLEHLRSKKSIVAYGIAFAGQEAETLPAGPHDQRLDGVITPVEHIDLRTR